MTSITILLGHGEAQMSSVKTKKSESQIGKKNISRETKMPSGGRNNESDVDL